jgi:hypothetical protein
MIQNIETDDSNNLNNSFFLSVVHFLERNISSIGFQLRFYILPLPKRTVSFLSNFDYFVSQPKQTYPPKRNYMYTKCSIAFFALTVKLNPQWPFRVFWSIRLSNVSFLHPLPDSLLVCVCKKVPLTDWLTRTSYYFLHKTRKLLILRWLSVTVSYT